MRKWDKLFRSISACQMEKTGTATLKGLAEETGIDYTRMLRIRKDPSSMRLGEFMAISKAVGYGPERLNEL